MIIMAMIADLVVMLPVGKLHYGQYVWSDPTPSGPLHIVVDRRSQTMSVFRGRREIGATAILFGVNDHPTPTGRFPIRMRDADHRSRTYGNAPMPYTLGLTQDGVAIHGTTVKRGYATHGCIGVPIAFAKLLFRVARVGDIVEIR